MADDRKEKTMEMFLDMKKKNFADVRRHCRRNTQLIFLHSFIENDHGNAL